MLLGILLFLPPISAQQHLGCWPALLHSAFHGSWGSKLRSLCSWAIILLIEASPSPVREASLRDVAGWCQEQNTGEPGDWGDGVFAIHFYPSHMGDVLSLTEAHSLSESFVHTSLPSMSDYLSVRVFC